MTNSGLTLPVLWSAVGGGSRVSLLSFTLSHEEPCSIWRCDGGGKAGGFISDLYLQCLAFLLFFFTIKHQTQRKWRKSSVTAELLVKDLTSLTLQKVVLTVYVDDPLKC